jgi:hypothetical protein
MIRTAGDGAADPAGPALMQHGSRSDDAASRDQVGRDPRLEECVRIWSFRGPRHCHMSSKRRPGRTALPRALQVTVTVTPSRTPAQGSRFIKQSILHVAQYDVGC